MIIHQSRSVDSSDPTAFAWTGLRRSQNVELLTQRLMDIHAVPAKHRENVRKQALQIRYCLIQAREYFTAASSVTLATKPNLLYYGTMSLALAEILFKQTGDSSLDKARAENRHHGLTMAVGGFGRTPPSLTQAAQQLRASPVSIEGKRKGTFELWHRSSREHPLVGMRKDHAESGGSTSGYRVVYGASDSPYPPYPATGMSLADALAGIPLLAEDIQTAGLRSNMVRGTVSLDIRGNEKWSSVFSILFHPNDLCSLALEQIQVAPRDFDRVSCIQINRGYQVTITNDWIYQVGSIALPPAAMVSAAEWRMWCNNPSLNEFGYFYLALYLAGNYARYFPDKWLLDVETAGPLALALERLCEVSEWRIPWLTLCEMDQILYVREP